MNGKELLHHIADHQKVLISASWKYWNSIGPDRCPAFDGGRRLQQKAVLGAMLVSRPEMRV
jgi:hypothetical protein